MHVKDILFIVWLLSQAIGEPPLFLAASVFFAIKEAVKSARSESGITGPFEFWSPASAERIRMACKDQFVDMVSLVNFH